MAHLNVSGMCAALMALATAQPSLAQARATNIEKVRGAVVLHWEYPHFVRQDGREERVYEIDIRDQKWRAKHFGALSPETHLEPPIFCVEAEGYEDPGRLGPTHRTTFVLNAIKSTKLAKSEFECRRGNADS